MKWTSPEIQMASSPWPSTNLQGKKIRISGWDTDHIQFYITPWDKFWDQWTLIRSRRTNSLTINDAKIITKTPNKNTWQIINNRNNYNLEDLTVVQAFKNSKKYYKNNGRLVWLNFYFITKIMKVASTTLSIRQTRGCTKERIWMESLVD